MNLYNVVFKSALIYSCFFLIAGGLGDASAEEVAKSANGELEKLFSSVNEFNEKHSRPGVMDADELKGVNNRLISLQTALNTQCPESALSLEENLDNDGSVVGLEDETRDKCEEARRKLFEVSSSLGR